MHAAATMRGDAMEDKVVDRKMLVVTRGFRPARVDVIVRRPA
jgi:hypothetical protein